MAAKTRDKTLKALKRLKKEVAERYHVKNLELFGSVAREDNTIDSDIDILVEFEIGADLFDLTGLSLFLEETLGQKVDVVPKQAIRPELRNNIIAEAISV